MPRLPIYEVEVSHPGLNKYRHIRGTDRDVVNRKAAAQERDWEAKWGMVQQAESKRNEREKLIQSKEAKKNHALQRTEDAIQTISNLRQILHYTLSVDDAIQWESLLDYVPFPDPKPVASKAIPIPSEPHLTDLIYQPHLSLLDKLIKKRKLSKTLDALDRFKSDHKDWEAEKLFIDGQNKKGEEALGKKLRAWENKKKKYEDDQQEGNNRILEHKKRYFDHDPEAISDYCEMVLSRSDYPDFFPREWDLQYQPASKIVVIDYSLPNKDDLPTLKSVKYVISKDEFTESYISASEASNLYDELLYQIALRTIHELYEADSINALGSIVFNGWVDSVDKATGNNFNACIMSLQASKEEFLAINLAKVDPRVCFKQLKGVGSSKLHGLSPIAPIISLEKEDKRFVSAYDVAEGICESDNLAVMDWQDFEHLIREMFHKEFSTNGGEVKITQASRDGGVDAVAFDPDPIRGGKIVIQAKRYANVVGVSAVRDLYGTTMNEGATKGILVTTSDYGPDAYEFARGKPLTLLNGSNLLHLLEKHGHKAKIDLKEAKKLLSDKVKQ